MRKIIVFATLLCLLVCLIACNLGGADTADTNANESTETASATDAGTVTAENSTTEPKNETPETPQDKWTGRY